MYLGFSIISLGCFITSPFIKDFTTQTILYSIYFFVFLGGLVRFSVPKFSLLAIVLKNISKCCHLSSSVWQISSVLGPAVAGFSDQLIGVHGSMFIVLGCPLRYLL
jgi:hypothetical protein